MGLDQYWLVKEQNEEGEDEYLDIHTHRKFNALQGFMQEEWAAQGNEEDFNCQNLEITSEILNKLEERTNTDTLKPTSGFFFGSTEKDDWYYEDLKHLKDDVIPDIRQRIEAGETIVYSCWY